MKQLERLLQFQGHRCFFCDQPIPSGEASVEHLVATANGGTNEDDNCVVCCKALNAAFGSRPYKEQLRAILNHRGQFACPRSLDSSAAISIQLTTPTETSNGLLAVVVADLQKRGASRPRKVETLRNTIAAIFQKQLDELEPSSLFCQPARARLHHSQWHQRQLQPASQVRLTLRSRRPPPASGLQRRHVSNVRPRQFFRTYRPVL
ncbi:MAG: HNH endonuclease [Burkholderiales bacterium]